MGNIVASGLSIGVPLANHLVTIPYIFHPHRWGGVPWSEPNFLFKGIITFALNTLVLMIIGTISGLMTTKKECNKTNIARSIKRSLWLVMGYVLGNLMLFIFPFIKAPFLPFTLWLPYAGWLVHGFCVSVVVLFFGAMGNSILRQEVC
jgi:hypothetical protein